MTTISHPAGRFVAQPVQRGNLTGDLRGFLAATFLPEGNVTAEEHEELTQLAQALVINVLDAHLDASYWQGRADGYANHHGAVSDVTASIEETDTQGAHE